MNVSVEEYNSQQTGALRDVCELLSMEITKVISGDGVTTKIWHSAPVWFDNGNPIVGYWARKESVQLLFWSGQSFGEPGLTPEGKFEAAEKNYSSVSDVDVNELHAWLCKSLSVQWDYKNIVKRRGELVRLK